VSGHVIADPDPRSFAAEPSEYPVSGDLIALHLRDPHPQNVSVTGRPLNRVPFGDLLWPAVAASTHPGRR
jgi:hypothetical protein